MRDARIWASLLAAATLAGCQPAAETAADGVAKSSAPGSDLPLLSPKPAEPDTGPLKLAVPINAVMVSMVDFAADGIWRPAAQDQPMTESQWLYARQDAVNIVAAATLMTSPGAGENDAGWVKDDEWRKWSREVQTLGVEAIAAVDAKDQARLKAVGDRLVEVCQACHQKFKPGLPSMGITRFPVYPKRPEN